MVSFSLNSVVGFACSLGINMGFNSGNHHPHNRSKKFEHSEAVNHHKQVGNNSYKHQTGIKSHHHSYKQNNTVSITSSRSEDNCCKDFVVGFQSMDKLPAKQNGAFKKITDFPQFAAVLIAEANCAKGFVHHYQIPPKNVEYSPPEKRIFIQSFLI